MKKIIFTLFITAVFTFNSNAQSVPISGNSFHYYGPNTSWGEYLKVGGNGRGTTKASVVATNGNLHLDSKDGNATYLNHYSKGNTYLNTQGGNVGIGTSSPAEKLHVNGSIRGNVAGGSVRLKSAHGYIDVGAQNTSWAHIYTDRPKIIFNKDVYTTTNAFSSYNNDLILRTKGTERLRVDDVSGNVGINTTAPKSKLHINGDLFMNAGEGFRVFGDANYFGEYLDGVIFEMQDGNSTNGNTDGGFVFRGHTPTDNVSKNWMVIKSGGLVGIGTNTPDAKLAVNGKIHAKEVKVDLAGWPDYVFETTYNLPTLTEVENHIQKNGHLINIPSAEKVEQDGVLLGEMNKKLLEKIEELTLYAIAQEKKILQQESKNQELETRLEKLENLLQNNTK